MEGMLLDTPHPTAMLDDVGRSNPPVNTLKFMNTLGKLPATKQDVETAVENAIEKLALMINEGFTTTASKEDITAVTTRLDGIDSRLDRIEHLLLAKQEQRLNDLETRMKKLEDALAV
jgi:uncharacterized protein Yka (UPF0111/DUF47 family)